MTNAPFGRCAGLPCFPIGGEILLGLGAVAAVAAGAFWLFGTGPAPSETVRSASLIPPAATSPMPKLDHDDPANPTVSFMTAVALAHVASLKLPAVVPVPGNRPHVAAVKVRAGRGRQNVIPALFKPLPPHRPAGSIVIQSKGTNGSDPSASQQSASGKAVYTFAPPVLTPVVQIVEAAPVDVQPRHAPRFGVVLLNHLTGLVPTPEALGHGISWVGDSVGSLARKL